MPWAGKFPSQLGDDGPGRHGNRPIAQLTEIFLEMKIRPVRGYSNDYATFSLRTVAMAAG